MKSADNPEGPATPEWAQQMKKAQQEERGAIIERFTQDFFSPHGVLLASALQRSGALAFRQKEAPHAAP